MIQANKIARHGEMRKGARFGENPGPRLFVNQTFGGACPGAVFVDAKDAKGRKGRKGNQKIGNRFRQLVLALFASFANFASFASPFQSRSGRDSTNVIKSIRYRVFRANDMRARSGHEVDI